MKQSIVNFSKLLEHNDWRWDSEYICFEPLQNVNLSYLTIGETLKSSQYGMSIDMNDNDNGCKIYRMNEITNMFCDRTINKRAPISDNEIKKYKLYNNDILFNRTNSQEFVGRTGIFKTFSDEDIIFASYLIRLKADEDIVLPEYLTVFLNTKHGIQDVKRRARISINQSNVNAEELKKVKIPIIKKKIQLLIKRIFDTAFDLIIKSEKYYEQAQFILLSELGLLNWKPLPNTHFIKNFSDVCKNFRFDSEYYQPCYDQLVNKIQKYKNGSDTIDNLVSIKDNNYKPIENKLYKYVELSNIGLYGDITGYTEEIGIMLPSRAKRLIKTNDIIVSSIEGSLSCIALINEEFNNAICSNGFFVLESEYFLPESLLILMKSVIGQFQLKKGCIGTILTSINKDEFKKIVLPKIDNIQVKIKNQIIDSVNYRRISDLLLTIARKAVEIAIDNDEKKSEQYINDEVNKLGVKI